MIIPRKILPCGALGLTLLGAIGVVHSAEPAESVWTQRAAASVAVIQGDLDVRGLHHAVRVQRDKWGVAHIYALDQHDLFFAQGFVVAQDRSEERRVGKECR